jgi:hypothetical protein
MRLIDLLRRRKQETRANVDRSIDRRKAAEAELAATEKRRKAEDVSVVRPLQRMRAEMLTTNHVTEAVVKQLRERGAK